MAIAIVVHPTAARPVADCRLAQSRVFGHIGECAVAVVVIEHVLAVVGDEEVVEAVVVVVADGHRGRPTRALQSSFGRDVGERAVAIVLVEAVGGTGGRAFQAGAAENEQIHPSIVVVVDETPRHSRRPQ